MTIARSLLLAVALAPAGACVDMDSFVWNPRHCSLVDPAPESFDCAERKMCTPCDAPLPFEAFGVPADHVEQVTIDVGEGVTNDAYFIRGSGARADLLMAYAHGNFGGIEHYLNRVGLLYQSGADLFVLDYRGFGKSSTTAEPTEEQFNADLLPARDAMIARRGEGQALVIVGFSAGALAATELALLEPPCGLILENSWPSVQAFTDDSSFIGVPQSFLTTGSWDTIAKMPRITAPYLHLHGALDETVRHELGRQVFDSAASDDKSFLLVDGAEHGNFGDDVPTVMGPAYLETIGNFLDHHLVCPSGA